MDSDTDECIIWPMSLTRGGYPQANIDNKPTRVNRYVCELAHGPSDLHATHECGVRACINPRHLVWGTVSKNQLDRVTHGTDQRGEKHPMVKITETDVRRIRDSTESANDIAIELGITSRQVRKIRTGASWSWVV